MSNLPVPYTPQNQTPKIARRHKAREPRQCLITLFNTERVPAEDTALILRDVFGKAAKEAKDLSYFDRHISVGPYTREAAETKMQQVRAYAAEHHLVAPVMQRRFG